MIAYTLKRNVRSRGLRIALHRDGSVVVTAPRRTPKYFIDRAVQQRAEWILEKQAYFKKQGSNLPVSNKADYKLYKEPARALAIDRVAHFNEFYGFVFKRISIRNQQTRWGSCSKKGNLNFSYRIALLEPHLADYIVVHELCHLGEFNHSPKFWALVARTMPEYKEYRRALRA